MKLFSRYSNLRDHDTRSSHDGRTICQSNTALYVALRGNNKNKCCTSEALVVVTLMATDPV